MLRPFPWLLGAALAGALSVARPARAQSGAVVVEVTPAASSLDAETLRARIATELGVETIPPGDARAAEARGTLTIDLDRETGDLAVTYLARATAITRHLRLPDSDAAARDATVLLAGNLARDEAADLAAKLRTERREPAAAIAPAEAVASANADRKPPNRAAVDGARLQATLDDYARRERASRQAVGWSLLGAGVVAGGAATYMDLRWQDGPGALVTGLVGGSLVVEGLVSLLATRPFEDLAALGRAGSDPLALEMAWVQAARRERRVRRVSSVVSFVAGGVTLALGAGALLQAGGNAPGSTGNDAFAGVILGTGAIEVISAAYVLATPGPLESGLDAYEASSGRGGLLADGAGLGHLRLAVVPGGAVAGFGANF